MKKISIMITTYNNDGYIDEAIKSVVNQEIPCDWELLIGDDGSTDMTIDIINLWVSRYPGKILLYQWDNALVHSMNGFRAASNRARLLEKANGDYLIFLDGDDCWLGKDKLQRQFDLLEDPKYQDCSCCGHNIIKYNITSKESYSMVHSYYGKRVFTKKDYYRNEMYVHTNTLLFRSSCKPIMLESLNRLFLNDTFITFCMLQNGNMLYIPDSYAKYNITGTGLWTGSKRVYGRFRNMHLYDLERYIDPGLDSLLFRGASSNIEVILKEYKSDDIETITPLVEGLDPRIFEYTLTLYSINTSSDKINKFKKRISKRILLEKINHRLYLIKRYFHLM